jgi:DNA-binding transcriptional ArsR family regulator
MTEEVLVLEPGDERAQKIAKAMGSPTAGEILHLLADGQKSLSDITEKLAIPMNTAKYHIENLLDAGLISVADTRYSIKGRQVKIYSLTDQLLIVAPRRADVRSLLLKYASLFSIVAIASLGISSLLPLLASSGATNEAVSFAMQAPAPEVATGDGGASREVGTVALKASYDAMAVIPPSPFPDPAVAFFLGGVLVIVVLLCYEAWLWKKAR